jgi:hypothetical protein
MHKKFLFLCCVAIIAMIVLIGGTGRVSAAETVKIGDSPTAVTLISEDETGLELRIDIGAITFTPVTTRAGDFTLATIEGFLPSPNIGEPNVPVVSRLLSIPFGCELEARVLDYSTEEVSMADLGFSNPLMPVQPSLSKSADPDEVPFEYQKEVYSVPGFYALPKAMTEIQGFLRSLRIGQVYIAPVEYNPVSGVLSVATSMTVRIDFINADWAKTNAMWMKNYSPAFEQLYGRIINYTTPAAVKTDLTSYPIKYAIVSDRMFESQLQPFINWKTRKGFEVITAYTDVIGSSNTAIKSYLEGLYNNGTPEDPAPSFVLFVGDAQQIPPFNGSAGSHITDLRLCEFTGDNLPEMYYGRFSAQNTTQLQPQIDKTLEYEQYAMPDPSHLAEVTMVAGVDATYAPTYGNGQINYGTNLYFNTAHGITSNTWLYPASAGSGVSAAIRQTVNDGIGYINYTAHGSHDGWYNPSFSTGDINNLTNNDMYPLSVGNCCLTNTFGTDYGTPCFGETWLQAADKGGIGYIGASNGTYWSEDYWWGVGFGPIIGSGPTYEQTGLGAYDGVFHDHGEPVIEHYVTNAAMMFAGDLAINESTSSKKMYFWEIYHLMGDPSVMTYFGVPAANTVSHPGSIQNSTTVITVTADPGSYIGVSYDGTLHGAGYVDASGSVDIDLLAFTQPCTAEIVVTGQNKIPYFGLMTVTVPPDSWSSTYGGPYDDYSRFVQPLEDTAWYLDDTTVQAFDWTGIQTDTLTLGQSVSYYLYMSMSGATGGFTEIRRNGNLIARLNYTGVGHDTSGVFFADSGDVITAEVDLNTDKGGDGAKDPNAEASFIHFTHFPDGITIRAFVMIGAKDTVAGYADIALVQTDLWGVESWSTTHGTSGRDHVFDARLTRDDGYIVVGDMTDLSGTSVYLAKFDSIGGVEWDNTYHYGIRDTGKSVIEVYDGYVIAGKTDLNGDNDVLLIKVDFSGTEQWHYVYGDAGTDEDANEVIRTSDGGYLAIGSSGSLSVDWDIYLVKADADGILTWTKRPGTPSYEECGNGVAELADGYMLGGTTNETGDYNMLLMKVDAGGNEVWRQNYGGGGNDQAYDLLMESGGGCVLVGRTDSYGSGMSDFYCVFTDPLGNLVDYTTFGGPDDEIAYDVKKTADAGYVVTGSTESYGAGNSDFYTVKFVGVPPPPPALVAPEDGYEQFAPRVLSLFWNDVPGATSYRVQLDNNSDFSSPIINVAGVVDTTYTTPSLGANTYYWRVSTTNAYGDGGWSVVRSFTLHSKVPVLSYPTNGSGIENEDSLRLSWWCVWDWPSYDILIDDDPNFGSPERNETVYCDCYWKGFYYISPALSTGTRYYWKVRAANLSAPWSQTWNFFLQRPPTTSCPVLYTYDGFDFIEENPLLTACERSGHTEIVTDYYHVTGEMIDKNGEIVFQLKELDEEITYLYDMELITVDHSSSTKIGCSVDGNIFAYRETLLPLSAVDHTGTDQLAVLVSEDKIIYRSEGYGHLTITFPNPGIESGFSFNAPPKLPCPHEDPGDPFPKAVPEEELPPSALTVELLTDDGDWVILPDVPARKNAVAEFVLSALPMEITSEVLTIRISWEDGFSTDVIRQHIPAEETPFVSSWSIESHDLSLSKPVAGTWSGFDGETPLVLAQGDYLEFSFAPTPAAGELKRDYILRAVGRYQPDNSVFSDILPVSFQLYHNYPNPFNPVTTIRYDLPDASQVKLEVYNVLGQRVATLVDESQEAGQHQVDWNSVDSDGRPVASGIYFYRLTADEYIETKKMMLLK